MVYLKQIIHACGIIIKNEEQYEIAYEIVYIIEKIFDNHRQQQIGNSSKRIHKKMILPS